MNSLKNREKEHHHVSIEEHQALKEELANFVYTISHDLNAPLRHTREFTKLLIKKLGERVTDDERVYVRHIEKSVYQLESMIKGMLEYSRLNTHRQPVSDINTEILVEEVKKSLEKDILSHQAVIEVTSLPAIRGDASQIKLLFMHLLHNAIIFHKEDVPPKVIISGTQAENNYIFSIKDNGVGLPKGCLERAFSFFQRFHDDDTIPGIGIGLAITKKIVELHGGEIWLESEVDKGATVHFSLPETR